MTNLLSNYNVLITGAASGIGACTAELAAQVGARVALVDLDVSAVEQVAQKLGPQGHHIGVRADVSEESSVQSAFATVREAFGDIHAVIHAAGIWHPNSDGKVTDVPSEIWQQTIDVNLTGTFYVCREAVAHMEKNPDGGSIVNFSSVVAITGWDKLNAYSASKGGVLSLSRSLAVECAESNIRVNCICPGVIETPMTSKVLSYSKPQVLPLGRLGRPKDIAQAAVFLSSDWSSFMTGSTMVVDGGFSAA